MILKTSRTVFLAIIVLAFGANSSMAADGHKGHAQHAKKASSHGADGETVELTGEIIDITCYVSHPDTGRGEDHAQCAEACLDRGLPPGLLVGDQLYLLLADNHKSANEKVAEFAGHTATIKGVLKEVNGLKTLFVREARLSK